MFQAQGSNGFQMTFVNGWTVSVQWGYGNYCNNRDNQNANKFSKEHNNSPSQTAEVAAWDTKNEWHVFEDTGDTVNGYMSPNKVIEFMAMIAAK